jgi:lambda family phage tail tape measure protein
MASKQVSEILVKLGIQGLQGLDKLKSSFRELERSIGPSAATIDRARDSIIAFGKEGKNTEQLVKGQIEALRGLQSQTERGSTAWAQLAGDIEKFRQASRRTDGEIEILRQGILSVATGANQSQQSLRSYIADLGRLRGEATITGSVFNALGSDIAELTARLQQAESQTTQTGTAFRRVLGQALASTAAGARVQLAALKDEINLQRELIESIDSLAAKERNLKKNKEERAAIEERLNHALARQRQVTFQESARAGRENVRSAAAAFADPTFLRGITPEALDRRLGELPNTTAGLNQQLSELSERLANTKRNTIDYLVVAMQMAGAQRELTAVTQGYAQSLLMGIRTGTVAPSARNLQEVISALRAEMSQLDTTTTEGARAYAENANQARTLENQLKNLANAYRHVGDMAAQSATAEASAATARVTANYLNRGLVRQQEQAMAELGQRVRAGVAATPLALPMAGQTSAPGTGLEISGGAVVGRATGRVQRVLTPGTFPGERLQGPELPPDFADRARRAAISEADAVRTAGEARARAERQIQSYRAEIDKSRAADIGSINSTQRLREAIDQYRSTLPSASAEFKKLTKDINELDARSEKLNNTMSRRRLTAGQAVQAGGAIISGGIFGGPEGFLGGVGGAVAGSLIPGLGTVGGAFAGAAIGAQVGMFRQSLAAVADYAAGLQKMQIALRNAAGSQIEFDRAMAAANAATRELNVPQEVAIQGMTKLTAAVKGAGGQVNDAEVVFRNITAAIKGTGGSAQDVDSAITAMVQVFSKGKVSAEELSGQLGERLPGAVTKFAKANQMELPELQKALEQGQVGLNELMKFVVSLGDEYANVAKQIADSSQDAGARLTVAYNEMRIGVGSALQPLGALLQGAFASFIEKITPALIIGAKGVSLAITGMYDAFVSGFGLIKQLGDLIAGLTKAFIVFGGVAGGIFVASNITTFTAAIGNLYKAFRALLSLQRLLLVVESARAAAQVLIAGLTTGATKGKIAGAIIGGGAGLAAAFGIGKLVESVVSSVTTGVEEQFKKFDIKGLTNFPTPTGGGDKTKDQAKEAEKERKNLFQELQARIQAQNNLLTQQGRLSEIIAKTEFDRAKESLKAAEEILLNQEQQLDLRFKFGEVSKDVYLKEKAAIAKQGEVTRAEFTKTSKDIEEKADKIYRDLFEPGGKLIPDDETPLEKALRGVDTAINEAQKSLSELGGPTAQKGLDAIKALTDQDELGLATRSLLGEDIKNLEDEIAGLQSGANAMGALGEIMQKHRQDWDMLDAGQRKYIENLAAIKDGLRFAQDMRVGLGIKEGAQQYVESIGTMREATAQLAQTGIKGVEDAIFSLVTTGTANFRDFAVSILKDTTRMIIQQLILRTIMQAIGAIGGAPAVGGGFKGYFDPATGLGAAGPNFGLAMGGIVSKNGIEPFAMGGIVNKPTLFRYADGGAGRFGLMGEAGPEAIIPLKRGRDGKLGVAGGGTTSVTVNVDAQGTQVQGDDNRGQQLGRVIAAAVQQELIKQKRPGGLLA